VQVLVTPVARAVGKVHGRLSDYLRALPPGTRTKEDIDQQIREERDSWMRLYLMEISAELIEAATQLRLPTTSERPMPFAWPAPGSAMPTSS